MLIWPSTVLAGLKTMSRQLKVSIGLALVGILYCILAGVGGSPLGYEATASIGLIAFLLGVGMYLGEIIRTWPDDDDTK